jgi:hypothetical protein
MRSVNRKERKVRKEEVEATGWSLFFAARCKKTARGAKNFDDSNMKGTNF